MRSILRSWRLRAAVALALVGLSGMAVGAVATRVGPRPDGTSVATYGWRITPAGRQTPLGEKPFGAALSPDGALLAVSNDGMHTQTLSLVDVAHGNVVWHADYKRPEALFVGLAWSPDGRTLYASAGGNDKIRVYTRSGATLTERAPILLPAGSFPCGIAVTPDGRQLDVADNGGGGMSTVDLATGRVLRTVPTGPNPYGVARSKDGRAVYVSNWGGATVSVVDTVDGTVRRTIPVGSHPTAITPNPVTGELYVSVTDADAVARIDPATDSVAETIDLAPYPHAPVGSSPQQATASADGRTLYVANAGNNDVAVVDLAHGPGRVTGLIPTGWYPTTVTSTRDGARLLVTNAKGLGAGPNPRGPQPTKPGLDYRQYVGSMIMGTLSDLPVPQRDQLARYTRQVRDDDRFEPARDDHGSDGVIPARPGDPSPIKHVIYIVKENRTYDQVFGSLGKGNGDPALNLFGDDTAPNQRALARTFVTLDNFYADGAVSSDGWEWATAAASNGYNEHLWPVAYGGRGRGDDVYANPATDPGKITGDSRIWDRLDDAHVSYRNYGMWADGPLPARVYGTEPRLAAHTDPDYAAQDLSIRDNSRVDEWLREFRGHVAALHRGGPDPNSADPNADSTSGPLPTMSFVRLGDDHTYGTAPGRPTPRAMVADNDLAVGRVVDAVSHSPYWADSAIFVTEDDAQDGPDHVDAHRTTAQVISPYTRTGRVDSTQYSTVSMLRTMELLAGIGPLTQYDAAATPMTASFTARPDPTPFTAITPRQSTDATNAADAPLAAESAGMDFTGADRAPEQELNAAIWADIKGSGVPMPAPRHAAGQPATDQDDADH